MEIEPDVTGYVNWLFNLAERLERYTSVNSMELYNEIGEVGLNQIASEHFRYIETPRMMTERGFEFSYFFPDKNERNLIEHMKNTSFSADVEEHTKEPLTHVFGERVVIERRLNEKPTYKLKSFYEQGEPPQIVGKYWEHKNLESFSGSLEDAARHEFVMGLWQDWGAFLFHQFLKLRLEILDGKANTSEDASHEFKSTPLKEQIQRAKRESTIFNDARRKKLYDEFIKNGLKASEALAAAAKKDGCKPITIERAIGWKKR